MKAKYGYKEYKNSGKNIIIGNWLKYYFLKRTCRKSKKESRND